MTNDRVTGLVAKGIVVAFTCGFFFWYISMKLLALRLKGP